jgi:hypothetical protein
LLYARPSLLDAHPLMQELRKELETANCQAAMLIAVLIPWL